MWGSRWPAQSTEKLEDGTGRRSQAVEPARRDQESLLNLLSGFALQDRRQLCDFLPHDLAGLEFDGRARRDDEAASRLVRVAAHTRLGELDFEDSEVSQLHGITLREGIGDVIERSLHDIEDLVLDQACFVTDFNDEFPFR